VISAHAASPGDVVISEFRTRGPNGPTDDFVELYNRTTLPINMSGWKIEDATGSGSIDLSPLVTFGSNFTLQSGQHFLAVGAEQYAFRAQPAVDHPLAGGVLDVLGAARQHLHDDQVIGSGHGDR